MTPGACRDRLGRAAAGAVVLSAVVAATTAAAPAQEEAAWPAVLGVLQQRRQREDNGLRVGSLILKPSLAAAGIFDSNVFAAPRHERSDWFASLRPRLDIESDWPRHAFTLRAQGEFRRYARFQRENQNNASVAATGRFDLAENAYLLAGGSYQLLHEDRGALVPVNGVHPTQFTVTSGKAAIVLEPSPLGLRLDATVDSYAFNNVALFDGRIVPETARDRIVYALTPRVSYRIVPEYDAFVRAVINRRVYNSTREPDGLDRNSTGYAADIGTAFRLPGSTAGEFYAGYLRQDYAQTGEKPIAAFDFGGKMAWRPNPATSLHFTLSRSVEDSAILGSQGYLQTAVRLGIEHEVTPHLVLLGSLGFINADFAGRAGSSDLYDLRLGARYQLWQNLSAGLDYDLARRASSAGLPSYTRQIVELRLNGRL